MFSAHAPSQRRLFLLATAGVVVAPALARISSRDAEIKDLLASSFEPVAKAHDVPGMAVGLVLDGQQVFVSLGATAREGGSPVTPETLFEVGSISKCFTSLLAAKAYTDGLLDLDQPIGNVLPSFRSTAIGQATASHLATYTAGGLPLQFPDGLATNDQALAWLRSFPPSVPPGAIRRYSNPSIGLLGHLTAQVMRGRFAHLVQRSLFEPLGLHSTFIDVPAAQMYRYSWGHDLHLKQVRVNPGVFDAEAYGVKTTARDMLQFLSFAMDTGAIPAGLRRALDVTMIPRYQAGVLTQCMGWESYSWPAPLDRLLQGNGSSTVLHSLPAKAVPTCQMQGSQLILNKTGSTGGFGAYVALLPHKRVALVMLANRNVPAIERVAAARTVLATLAN